VENSGSCIGIHGIENGLELSNLVFLWGFKKKPKGGKCWVGGGVLFNPKGNIVASYAWGISQATNNQLEAYTLLRGILIAREERITL
jgi:hypothetical protein